MRVSGTGGLQVNYTAEQLNLAYCNVLIYEGTVTATTAMAEVTPGYHASCAAAQITVPQQKQLSI